MLTDSPNCAVSSGGPDTILVAEDDPVFRLLLQKWLEQWQYKVITADNGAVAWQHLQSDRRPRLLLLDWMMPGIDGVEICRRVRALKREWYSYILVITAKADQDDVIVALDAGADDFIAKPIEPNELRARLQVGQRILRLQDELVRSREQLRFQATRDALTGLPNRRCILQALHEELSRSERTGCPLGVLMLDLDHFKRINDSYGHLAGDAVLAEVAGRLVSAVRLYDKVGRYGGEEFLIVLPDCSQSVLGSIGERIVARVAAKPVIISGAGLTVTLSAGGAVGGSNRKEAAVLIRNADDAMYQAKERGRNCCVIRREPAAATPEN